MSAILFILQCNPDFLKLVGTRKLVNIFNREVQEIRYIYTYINFVTDNFQEVQKLWVWEIGLLYYLIGQVANASFKQGVEILLMPKIDKAHKNYLKPEI